MLQALILAAIGGTAAAVHGFLRPFPLHSAPTPANGGSSAPREAIEIEEAKQHFDAGDAVFIDARQREEFVEGHVPGALLLPFYEFSSGRPRLLDFLPEDRPLIIYCEGGDCHSSKQVGEMLRDYGFAKIRILEVGWPAWVKAGYPAEKGPPAAGPDK